MRTLTILILFAGCVPDDRPETRKEEQTPVETIQEVETTIEISEPGNVEGDQQDTFKVVGIIDGDTIDVLTSKNETVRLRLNGIDCPETGQPFGRNAKQYLSDTIGGKMVRIVKHDVDRYGRAIADIYLPVSDPLVNLPDMFLNRQLVKRGLAWHYKQYSDDERLHEMKNRPERPNWGSGATYDTLHRGTGGSCQRKNGIDSDKQSIRQAERGALCSEIRI